MKRWSWMILLVALAALLVGCTAAGSGAPLKVTSTDDVQRITPAKAKDLLDTGDATLYDTRSAEAYRKQHAEGAISLPEGELAARSDELTSESDKALIFYCT